MGRTRKRRMSWTTSTAKELASRQPETVNEEGPDDGEATLRMGNRLISNDMTPACAISCVSSARVPTASIANAHQPQRMSATPRKRAASCAVPGNPSALASNVPHADHRPSCSGARAHSTWQLCGSARSHSK
eukprot:5591094-Prymnesium_polylepis.1